MAAYYTESRDMYPTFQVLELKFIVPTAQTMVRIFELWERTFVNRLERRTKGTLAEYLKDFPVIGAFDGELVKMEFMKIKPAAKSFTNRWDELQSKILQRYADMFVESKNDFIRTLAIIRAKCPSRGAKRNKTNDLTKKNPLSGVIEWINAEDDFPNGTNTPVLIGRGSFLEDSADFAVCWGSTLINVQLDVASAFEVYFCAFTAFGVEPPHQDKQFHSFINGAVCGLGGMSTTCEKFLVSLD